MKGFKKISVIVPTLNEIGYIGNLIDSIYFQKYRPLELIFVDGGSSDGTIDIIKRKAKFYNGELFDIKLFYEKDYDNLRGTANARNIGIEESTGGYIVFLDADMFFLTPDSLERITSKLEKVIFTRVKTKVAADTELERQISLGYSNYHHCAYRREVLEKVRFNPVLSYGEDQDLWHRANIDEKELCDVTVGRHLPHTKKELKSQQMWYGRTFLPFMKNALVQRQFIIFFLELHRLMEYCFLLFSPLIVVLASYLNTFLGSIILVLIFYIYLTRLFSSPERDIKRLKYLVWSSFFIPYYFIYGILSSLFDRLMEKS